ncbi:fumarylacetoacetate hydrolase domain-containing protein 2-like [Actinia tenebrosa]|uniref:Fumarylacetoacetate hydrolase domain-containing protein 2-like n=1 Tax=Actinia tenebrosa TaxID=6105 RepID=A0A6P8IKK9_ACTTE|nr:fumarylacetoacetate hydrolase domain-containing protein 2-like [Actinia tenebrosa]
MRLVQFEFKERMSVGVELVDGGDLVDLHSVDSSIPTDMKNFLESFEDSKAKAQRILESGKGVISRAEVKLKAPIYNPEKVLCGGMNYVDHCREQNAPIPKEPVFFSKFANAIIGTGDPIILNSEVKELDYEVELAFIIGKKGKNIKEEDAMNHVAGYTVAHDVSERYWQLQKNAGQWFLGKTFDTFCPLGPALVTKDSVSDVNKLGIRCCVNGQVRQDSNTENLIFKIPTIIAFVSRLCTLKCGDVILTGTPPGVGVFRKPPIFLKDGDVVQCEIDEIGCIKNQIQTE